MKTSVLLCGMLFVLGACRTLPPGEGGSEIKANGSSVGQFMGLSSISTTIAARMLAPGFNATNFSLRRYLPGANFFGSDNDLGALLGRYVVVNGNGEFQNGTPNAMNMSLWFLVMSGMAGDVAKVCDPPPDPNAPPPPGGGGFNGGFGGFNQPLEWKDTFKPKVVALCDWPADAAKAETAMSAYWKAIMGFQAPAAAQTAWRDEFTANPAYATLKGKAAVRELTLAILMQPHFLLTK